MRTTLDIDDDILVAAKELARRHRKTTGKILSELAREMLTKPARSSADQGAPEDTEEFLGFKPLPARGVIVTNELINQLRDEDIY